MTDEAKNARREYMRRWREENRLSVREYSRNWRRNNREAMNQYAKDLTPYEDKNGKVIYG